MAKILDEVGFSARPPEGAYYVLAGFRGLPVPQAGLDATSFARWLTVEAGVAVVPGTAGYSVPGLGDDVVRFAFCKRLDTLRDAGDRLQDALQA
jgi:aminotransferase